MMNSQISPPMFSGLELKSFKFHMAISILLLLVFSISTNWTFLIVAPILTFMMLRPRREYFLPIIIYLSFGQQATYLGGVLSFIYCVVNLGALQRIKLLGLFLVYAALAPVFVYIAVQRWGVMPTSAYNFYHGTVYALSQYCCLSSFFTCAILLRTIPFEVFKGFNLVCILVLVSAILNVVGLSKYHLGQHVFWALAYAGALLASLLFGNRGKGPMAFGLTVFFVVFVGLFVVGGATVSFTQFGLVALSFLTMFVALKHKKALILLSPLFWMIISVIYVLGSEARVAKYQGEYAGSKSYDELSMTSFDSMIERIQRKAIDDRAVLWAASTRAIKEKFKDGWFKVHPQIEPLTLVYMNKEGRETSVQTFLPSHNTFLQLANAYGIYGIVYFLILVSIVSFKSSYNVLAKLADTPYAPLLSASMTFVVFASFSGGAILNFPLSYLVLGSLGAGYRYYFELQSRNRMPF